MSTVGFSTLDVIPSVKGLRAELEKQTSRDFTAAGRKGGQQFGDAAGKEAGGRFKSKFGPLAKEAFAPIAGIVAGAAVVDLFKDAISGASDLAESGNKINAIFGDASNEVVKFADKGAKALGQTKLSVLDAAATFGTFGKAAGLSGDSLSGFSTNLVTLSTDLASFFNTDPSQAIEAIGAALRGEAEPIRAYGVLLDDATLRQEALRQGLIKTTKQALTPQQKVLASYQVILRQTADSQGDFERTSGGLANQQRILSAQWSEMKTELGAKLLPAVTGITRAFNNEVIPALGEAGSVTSDTVKKLAGLPGPVKAAAAAFVVLKVAALTGLGASVAAGFASAGSALVGLRIRALLAADAYVGLRAATITTTQSAHVFTGAASRSAAAMAAMSAAATGAGAAMATKLRAAMALVGGPWGLAFLGAAVVATKFWQSQRAAKQHVESLTTSLREQDGAITKLTRDTIAKALQDNGAVDLAKKYGIALNDIFKAATGDAPALARVNAVLDEQQAKFEAAGNSAGKGSTGLARFVLDATHLREAVGGETDALGKAKNEFKDHAELLGKSADESKKAAGGLETYATALKGARDKVQDLLNKENERRNANLTKRRDALGLQQQIFDSRKEAFDGARTLNLTTEEGRKNQGALLDLADQWNKSAESVKNAKGAYEDIRVAFIQTAVQMGATKGEAKKLADELLGIPKSKAINVTTPGMKQAILDAKALKAELAGARRIAGDIALNQGSRNRSELDSIRGHAVGGLIGGRGTGTSDSNLIWASRGEYMQRKRAVDYYGVDFMRRLNNLQVPKFANGGMIGGTSTVTHGPAVNFESATIVTQDTNAFLIDMQARARAAALSGG